MTVWAIADLHLSFGVPNKEMDLFGEQWIGYADKIKRHWEEKISPDDLVLIAGDISWAMHPEEAKPDLLWIHNLPGTKVILRGNHDYWWASLSKIEKVMPPSIHVIQNNVFQWNDIVVGGSRLWDTPEYTFSAYIQMQPSIKGTLTERDHNPKEAEKIFDRELLRLEMSLKGMDKLPSKTRIAMTHYPPISADLNDSRASAILERYRINACVFGHLHNVKKGIPMFGEKHGVRYMLTACDYLDFNPFRVL